MRHQAFSACSRGYTLIELLIVVALLGLAGSLVIPHMVGRSTLEVQAAVRRIVADLSFAQSDALAHQEYRRVHFFSDGSGYCLVRVTQATFNTTFDPDTADYLIDPISLENDRKYVVDFSADPRYSHVSLGTVSIDSGARHVTYDALGGTVTSGGTLPGTGGSIVVTSPEASYRINIAPFTGKLTVELLD